jgi:hypothetical protein
MDVTVEGVRRIKVAPARYGSGYIVRLDDMEVVLTSEGLAELETQIRELREDLAAKAERAGREEARA